MSTIDITFILIVLIGFLTGFLGKLPKKIFSLVTVILSVVTAFLTYKMFVGTILNINVNGTTLKTLLTNMIESSVGGGSSSEVLKGIVEGVFNILAFYLALFASFVIYGIIFSIISAIVCKRAKKRTAWKSFGLIGGLTGFIVASVLVFPIVVLSPVLTNANKLLSSNKYTTAIQDDSQKSNVLKIGSGILDKTKGSINFLKYEVIVDGSIVECNIYDDLKSFINISNVGSNLDRSLSLEGIDSLSDDEIRTIFEAIDNSEAVKVLFVSALEETLLEEGITTDIDFSDIDFSKEADTFITLKEITSEETISTEKAIEAMDTLASSKLMIVIASTQEGALKDIDTETKETMENKLQEKLVSNEISQSDYDTLMKLFESASA